MGKQRDAAEIARDRRRIAEMYLRGALQSAIADELGINQSTVSRDLKTLHAEWLQSALVDISEAKGRELAKIDALEREYWDAWVRSQEDAVTETTENRTGIHGYDREATQRVGQVGGAQYLAGVQWCIAKRCQILGLDAPTKIAPTDPSGEHEYSGIADELQRRLAGLAAAIGTAGVHKQSDGAGD